MALRGPHHCVGVANSVGEMIFRFLQARCQAAGGTLTPADLEEAKSHFVSKFPNAFDFFDRVNASCMEASASTAPQTVGRDSILPSLLLACGQKPARLAFEMQVARFGTPWLIQFFGGVAMWVRQHVANADERLVKLYASTAVRVGSGLAISDLLRQDAVKAIVRECLAPLIAPEAPTELAGPLSDQVSIHIAKERGIPKPDVSKVTEQQVRNFLGWLPPQTVLVLNGSGSNAA